MHDEEATQQTAVFIRACSELVILPPISPHLASCNVTYIGGRCGGIAPVARPEGGGAPLLRAGAARRSGERARRSRTMLGLTILTVVLRDFTRTDMDDPSVRKRVGCSSRYYMGAL